MPPRKKKSEDKPKNETRPFTPAPTQSRAEDSFILDSQGNPVGSKAPPETFDRINRGSGESPSGNVQAVNTTPPKPVVRNEEGGKVRIIDVGTGQNFLFDNNQQAEIDQTLFRLETKGRQVEDPRDRNVAARLRAGGELRQQGTLSVNGVDVTGLDARGIDQRVAQAQQPLDPALEGRDLSLGLRGVDIFGIQRGGTQGIADFVESLPFAQADFIRKELIDNPEVFKRFSDATKLMKEQGLTPEEITSDPTLQSLLRLELNEQDLKALKSGEVKVSNLAQSIEGLPFFGKVSSTLGTGLLSLPAGRVNDISKEIKKIDGDLTEWRSFAANNPQRAEEWLSLVDQTEQELLFLEAKIRLLVLQSPQLQANPEDVQRISREIDGALKKATGVRDAVTLSIRNGNI